MEIHKYKLHAGGENIINMPKGAKILCVQLQGDSLCLWAEVSLHKPIVQRTVVAYCTGETLSTEDKKYISTVQDGWFVVHFYDLGEYHH